MKPHDWIGELLSVYALKPLILVEGDEDASLYGHLLTLLDSDWRNRLEIEPVGGKNRVFQGCRRVAAWRGLVDRDEWAEDRLNDSLAQIPNVQVLPRFTAQSYWIDPDDLWDLIPASVRASYSGVQAQIKADIEAQRADWTAHGAMWRVMLRRQVGLGDLRFPRELMDAPVINEGEIMAILTQWHDHFNPKDIMAEYRVERDAALARAQIEQYAQVIHGKRFFRQVVTLAMNRAFDTPNKTAAEWAADLTASITTVPADLKPVLEALLA